MKIITATKPVALNLEYHNKEADVESLHQNVCHILNKTRNMKIKGSHEGLCYVSLCNNCHIL